MKKRRKTTPLSGCQVSIQREADYISNCASRHDARVVTLGPLLFFSTETGDAWALEPENCLARCLARDSQLMPSGITETPDNFAVEWETRYRFDGSVMVFTDREGSERTVLGYPVREIQEAIRVAAKQW
ncbi:MAG: hypothetical protein M3436_02975 [Pseudomonadota bacterium]|nr:hypothetical protein [Pseudomonadota bacterium]